MIGHPAPLTGFVLIALKKLEYLVFDKVGGTSTFVYLFTPRFLG